MEQENALISVIVTAYNIENYLEACLQSILAQTYSRLEIIVVDDGSTDRTAQICDDYQKKDERIRVLHKENGGPSAARNAGLGIASGSYIGYVDGDDTIEPQMYQMMLCAMQENAADIAVCTYRQIGEDAEEVRPSGKIIPLTREEALELYISGHEQYHIYHSVWSKLFKREILSGITFQEGRKSEDIMYTTQAMIAAKRCVFVDVALYNYTIDRQDSIMNSALHERRFRDEIPFWKEQIRTLRECGLVEFSEKAAYQFYRKMLFYYIDFRKRKMKAAAGELHDLLKKEKGQIHEIYQKSYVTVGDRVRMKLFLPCPLIYFWMVEWYDKLIIPLRQ